MSDTLHLGLPFVEAAQAQKHVTVNEALQGLDAIIHLAVETDTLLVAPMAPLEGERWLVAIGAGGDWAGKDGQIASWLDGAWRFFTPGAGWRVWIKDTNRWKHYDGTSWQRAPAETVLGESLSGASLRASVIETDYVITPGAFNDTSLVIPDRAIVLGVTGRVLGTVTGPTSWQLGVSADAARYGNMIGVATGSSVNGVSGVPTAYYSPTPVRVTGTDADLTGGMLRLALHYFLLELPSA